MTNYEEQFDAALSVLNPNRSFVYTGKILCDQPLRDETFKNKRFYRYADKIGNIIVEKLSSTSNNNLKYNIYNICLYNCAVSLSKKYFGDKYKDHYSDYGLEKVLEYPVNNDIFDTDKYPEAVEVMKKLIQDCLDHDTFPDKLISIAKEAFYQEVLNFLTQVYVAKGDSFYGNYTQIELDDTDKNYLIYEYQSKLIVSMELYCIEQVINNRTIISEKAFKEIQDKIKIVLKENTDLKKELKEKKEKEKVFLPTLVRLQKEAADGTEDQRKMYEEHIKAKDREIKKLEKQIEQLQEKLNRANKNNEKEEKIEVISHKIKECDTSLPYTFAMCQWSTQFEQQLLEIFPNAILAYSSQDFNPNTNLMIFLTAHIKHNMYYKLKSLCKNTNIPYIHFASSNMDLLKQEISKALN